MIPRTLNLGLLLLLGEFTSYVDASGSEAVKIGIVHLGLRHETRRGTANIAAFAVAITDVFGVDNLLPKTTWLLARRTERDDLEAHVGSGHSLAVHKLFGWNVSVRGGS